MHETDSILISLLKTGNRNVFESVYNKYYGNLFTYSKSYVLNAEVAQEMVQDTFLKLWEKKESLNDDTNIQALLYRIARNNCFNYLKRLKVEQNYLEYSKSKKTVLELNELALRQSSAEKIISEELEEKINDAIESLPPRCSLVFKMSREQGKKYKEIAGELNISIKTVENQIQKALKELRKSLSEFGDI